MKTLMANPLVGILVVVPLLTAVVALEALSALPATAGRFVGPRRLLFWIAFVLGLPFAAMVIGRFVYLR
jgi:hypothetical protein